MANIHVLVKNQDASGKGWLEAYTTYGAYGVYRIADEYQDMRLDLDSIGAEIITAAEAKSSIFADAYRGYVKLKAVVPALLFKKATISSISAFGRLLNVTENSCFKLLIPS